MFLNHLNYPGNIFEITRMPIILLKRRSLNPLPPPKSLWLSWSIATGIHQRHQARPETPLRRNHRMPETGATLRFESRGSSKILHRLSIVQLKTIYGRLGNFKFHSGNKKKTKSIMWNALKSIIFRRASTTIHNPTLSWRCYFSPPSSSSPPSNSKLFVGGPSLSLSILLLFAPNTVVVMILFSLAGLSWSVDEKSLKDAFSSFGEVTEVRILYDKDSGRSRGFGFVHFSMENDAKCAKDAMDGKAFLGRPLRISFAFDKVRGGPVVIPRLTNIEDDANSYS
ncbi:hypothetical protein FEM48_Zijuj11G0114500 [Ziziphus jujuba var. spinosa]|uniref:RRM domain-containing protein n=1 Tax=Ziziphus jujuba var. spinosa TaxID=714518 RepID=A0A978UIP0_ZIZJJ|nr:hypothetical protein FEM48_Zijuj11G0114500 [Ziziphus jujuba var. spinosa]